MRIIRGVAFNAFGDSYLDRMQRIAELESSLKMKRLERDIPKYQRAQDDYIKEMEKLMQHKKPSDN